MTVAWHENDWWWPWSTQWRGWQWLTRRRWWWRGGGGRSRYTFAAQQRFWLCWARKPELPDIKQLDRAEEGAQRHRNHTYVFLNKPKSLNLEYIPLGLQQRIDKNRLLKVSAPNFFIDSVCCAINVPLAGCSGSPPSSHSCGRAVLAFGKETKHLEHLCQLRIVCLLLEGMLEHYCSINFIIIVITVITISLFQSLWLSLLLRPLPFLTPIYWQSSMVSLFLSVYISVLSDSVCQCPTCHVLFAPFQKYRIYVKKKKNNSMTLCFDFSHFY